MKPADFETTAYHINAKNHPFLAKGDVMLFNGFLKVWSKYNRVNELELPIAKEKEELRVIIVESIEHQTQPPPYYKEPSLTKELKNLGIGRPSTYASIITLITSEDRKYAVKEKKGILKPTDIGKNLVGFLKGHFKDNFIEYLYTADLETKLDRVANGEVGWK